MSELKPAPKEQAPAAVPKRVQAKANAVKKKPWWQKFRETFFAETAASVGSYLWKDVLLPAIKKLVADAGTNAINMAIYGEQRARVNGQTHVSQSSVYAGRNQIRPNYNRSNRYNAIMENCPPCDKGLLIDIMNEIQDYLASYGQISVQALNQILPVELTFPTAYTDQNWGWSNLNYNCIVQVAGGWVLDLPPARPLQ